MDRINGFLVDESGAIAVDLLVLTASCVALGWLVVALVSGNAGDLGQEVSALISSYEIDREFDTAESLTARRPDGDPQ